MDPVFPLVAIGGIARGEALARRGVTRAGLRAAVHEGRIHRIRRGWYSLPEADPELRAAARVGGLVSCVSLTRRRGLWDPPASGHHLAMEPHARMMSEPTGAVHVHWAAPVLPRDPDRVEDRIENALVLVAACQPYEHGLAIWESAMSRGLLDREVLGGLALPPAARRLLRDAEPFADAGTETYVMTRLRWMRLPLRRQVWLAGHPVDLLIGERLVIQIDGGTHVDHQRLLDNAHDARLRLQGYTVIRVGYRQIFDDWPAVQHLIATAVGQGLHLAPRRP
ncbi:type IV toxin-antitoxin system AbiEi family antitoxin domain-containing protein [Microbacterium phosphatis]|uniref:type IV toxin-antitoxin system AbiEi family antitoxin domain-containing protein n=1 Tax=Microbacterium phosphatis TaxID=3140248 RepID=UPI003140BA21